MLIPAYPLNSFEIQKHYQNEPKFNNIYSTDNLPNKIKDEAYVINADEYSDIRTNWIALYALNNNVTYFGSFSVKHIPKKNLSRDFWLTNLLLQQIFIEYKQMIH